MEGYSSSSSKYSYLSQNTEKSKVKGVKQEYPFKFHSLLHSVRKTPAKSWKKVPVAPPMPPTPVKVYKVDALNFKDLVQQLTCEPEFLPPHPHQQFLQRIEHAATSIEDVPLLPLQNLLSREDTAVESPLLPVVTTTDNWYDLFLKTEDFGKTSQDGEMIPAGLLDMNLFSPTSFGNMCFYPPIVSPRM